jgi:hypothetical protein
MIADFQFGTMSQSIGSTQVTKELSIHDLAIDLNHK